MNTIGIHDAIERVALRRHLLASYCTACLVACTPAQAAVVQWTLEGVGFDDGATASGSFYWDSASSQISAWNIQVDACGS